MLDEREALSFDYDATKDVLTLRFAYDDARVAGVRDAYLLLDSGGYLVGLDLGDAGGVRPIVMIGPHEKVDRTHPGDLEGLLERQQQSVARAFGS